VWLTLGGVGALLATSFFLPLYVRVESELSLLEEEINRNAAAVATFDTSASALETAMRQATLLVNFASTTPLTAYDARIMQLASDRITIGSIEYIRNADTVAIAISGVARSRADLARFRDELEGDPLFKAVVLPISSLIKDRELDFTMTVTGVAL
jgi:Tfp pilus assembly protein PilN